MARRRPLHLAEVLSLGRRGDVPGQATRGGGAAGKPALDALLAGGGGGALYAGRRAWAS